MGVKKELSFRLKKGQNKSRKEALLQRKASAAAAVGRGPKKFKRVSSTLGKKKGAGAAEKKVARAAQRAVLKKSLNKQANPAFHHDELSVIHQGLVATIASQGEEASPLALFATSLTAVQSTTTPTHHIPYLLTILTATVGKISEKVLLSRMEMLFGLVTTLLGVAGSDNHLITNKAMKLAQAVCLAVVGNTKPGSHPTELLSHHIRKLIPNRNNTLLTPLFLTLVRKWLQKILDCGFTEYYFIILREWVSFMCDHMVDTRGPVAAAARGELSRLIQATAKPALVESNAEQWDEVMRCLCAVFKSHSREAWPYGCSVVKVLFETLSFVKRKGLVESSTENAEVVTVFESVFPSGALLLKVLDRLRQLDDSSLNPEVEHAMVALGRCMTVSEFMRLLPFNPHQAADAEDAAPSKEDEILEEEEEDAGHSSDDETGLGLKQRPTKGRRGTRKADPWARSYLMTVIRRIAAHDSLVFAAKEFLPRISDCEKRVAMYNAMKQPSLAVPWMVLTEQYWRIIVGFCHFPHVVTTSSFVSLAKALVGLLESPHLANISCTAIHTLCGGYHYLSQAEGPDADLFDEEDEEAMALNDEMFNDINDEKTNPHLFHGITKEAAVKVVAIFTKYSNVIMPKLCNAFEKISTTAVLDAISSFAKVCSPSVMEVILSGILQVGKNILEAKESGATLHRLQTERRVVLDIAYPMIATLSMDHLSQVYSNIVEPVLRDDKPNPTLQKKCYKLLLAMFEHRMKDMFPQLPRVLGVLAQGQDSVSAAGMKMRLRCLEWAVDAYKMFSPESLPELARHAVPELVICAKQPSHAIRQLSMNILEKLHRHMMAANFPARDLLFIVAAGLAGKTPMAVAGSIVVMAKLLWIGNESYAEGDVVKLVDLICDLMQHFVPEVRTGAVTFMRMSLKLMKRAKKVATAVENCLEKMLHAIALITSQPKVSSSVRTQMRQLTEKVIKRFGSERVESLFPEGSLKFVQHVAKALRRSERLKLKEQQADDDDAKPGRERDEFAEAFMIGEEDAEDVDGAGDDLLEGGGLTHMVSNRTQRTNFFDDEDEQLGGVTVRFEGEHLQILSAEQRQLDDARKKRERTAAEMLKKHGKLGPNISKQALQDFTGGKRTTRDDVQDFENEELVRLHGTEEDFDRAMAQASKTKAPSAMTRSQREQKEEARLAKRQKLEEGIRTGEEYSSGRALGDVKKGQLEPHAYVPLHPKFLNKRHARERTERLKLITTNRGLRGEKAARALRGMKLQSKTDEKK